MTLEKQPEPEEHSCREQAARLAKALESGGEPELFEEAVLLEKMSREDLQDLLEQTVVELGRLARTSPQKARVLKAAALTARLREAAELNVGGGAAAGPDFADNPGAAMGDGSFAAMLAEAEKYLGYPYVWGGSSPSTSFDCSGYVSWVINHSGVGNVGRQTAQGLYNLCTPVSKENMQPGDLIFFTGTYSTANPVTHVGIYIGDGKMIHCGDPISYANINTSYWSAKFYSGGRLP